MNLKSLGLSTALKKEFRDKEFTCIHKRKREMHVIPIGHNRHLATLRRDVQNRRKRIAQPFGIATDRGAMRSRIGPADSSSGAFLEFPCSQRAAAGNHSRSAPARIPRSTFGPEPVSYRSWPISSEADTRTFSYAG